MAFARVARTAGSTKVANAKAAAINLAALIGRARKIMGSQADQRQVQYQ
jgi:hypothetical protein